MAKVLVAVAVLPPYRKHFVSILRRGLAQNPGIDVDIYAGTTGFVESVQSASSADIPHKPLENRYYLDRRILKQSGLLKIARQYDVVVLDLNPRSISAWGVLLERKVRRKATLVWGHILPRAGRTAKTRHVRRSMRRLASGVISYTWQDSQIVHDEDSRTPVWVAANGIYPSDWLPSVNRQQTERDSFIYVGRLEPDKRLELALEGFAQYRQKYCPRKDRRLILVGDGSLRDRLLKRAEELEIANSVDLPGYIDDFEKLKLLYDRAIAAISPGYGGLGITQSLGFGVPIIIADREQHAPEIELVTEATGVYFSAGDPDSLADRFYNMDTEGAKFDASTIQTLVRNRYTADAMAEGFASAVRSYIGVE